MMDKGGMVMEDVVLGIDLGTSAVKIIAVNRQGEVIASTSEPLTLIPVTLNNVCKSKKYMVKD